jgi:hypothetical protein
MAYEYTCSGFIRTNYKSEIRNRGFVWGVGGVVMSVRCGNGRDGQIAAN